MLLSGAQAAIYKHILKPILFRIDPERVHDRALKLGNTLGRSVPTRALVAGLFDYSHPSLSQTIHGISFSNPIGLAAGFDKNAELLDILPSVGFGHAEIGSITAQPCPGNPGTRLWRHPEQKSLRVYYGLKNNGCEILKGRLHTSSSIPLGVSIAKTNNKATVDPNAAIDDYLTSYQTLADVGSYDTINISCPNAHGGQPFTDPELLDRLLTRINAVRSNKPLFLKLSPDISRDKLHTLANIATQHKVNGIICTNLTKRHTHGNGGLSGKAVAHASRDQLIQLTTHYPHLTLIACGGIFTAEDAYDRITHGASLVQLITGMIYEGPQLIGTLNRDLAQLLSSHGYTSVSDAVGTAL